MTAPEDRELARRIVGLGHGVARNREEQELRAAVTSTSTDQSIDNDTHQALGRTTGKSSAKMPLLTKFGTKNVASVNGLPKPAKYALVPASTYSWSGPADRTTRRPGGQSSDARDAPVLLEMRKALLEAPACERPLVLKAVERVEPAEVDEARDRSNDRDQVRQHSLQQEERHEDRAVELVTVITDTRS